jgi:hypothetical protein
VQSHADASAYASHHSSTLLATTVAEPQSGVHFFSFTRSSLPDLSATLWVPIRQGRGTMSANQSPCDKLRWRYLYAAYAVAAAGFAFAIWRGWFAQNSIFTTEVAPATIFVLVFATVLVRGGAMAALRAPPIPLRRAIKDLFKGIACYAFALGWVIALTRRVPDSYVGVAILAVPPVVVILWGGVYIWRSLRFVTGRFHRALLLPQTVPPPDYESSQTVPVSTACDHIEVPLNYLTLSLTFGITLLLYAAWYWLMARGNLFLMTFGGAGLIFLSYYFLRIAFGRGPGLIISSSGISVRRRIGLISNLPWSEVATVELKSTRVFVSLVIGVRNPERLIENAGAYRRWAMRQNLERFGSPLIVSVKLLKCDRAWLVQTIGAYRDRYGIP